MNQEEDLIKYLSGFVTKDRNRLFKKKLLNRTKKITIVLENIFQPRNISASIRSADCFGIQDIHIIENSNKYSNDSEVSLGSEKWTTIHKYKDNEYNTKKTINSLKKSGYKIIATTPENTNITLQDLNIKDKLAILFGGEKNGLSEDAINLADEKVQIPTYGFTESLNISVSVAICLYYLTSAIRVQNTNWKISKKDQNKILLHWLRNSIKSVEKIEELFKSNIL